jgi:hypothetical protein
MEGCSGYHIEDNFFHGVLELVWNMSPAYGIGVKNSGSENNEIYNNEFYRIHAGIIAIGENRGERDPSGLCLKCNDMIENMNDFIVVEDDGPPTGIQGIRLYQGNPEDTISITAPAGNTFTNLSGKPADYEKMENFNYFNGVEDIFYLHHSENATYQVFPGDSNYTRETIELREIYTQFNKSQACPSGLGGVS